MPRPWVKVDRQYIFAILPDHRRQPRADQSRRASVVIGAVLPKNAQASDWLSRTGKPSSSTERISAFQMDWLPHDQISRHLHALPMGRDDDRSSSAERQLP